MEAISNPFNPPFGVPNSGAKMPKLTDVLVAKIPFSQTTTTIYDSLLPAFGVRTGARTKTFIIVHRGSRRRIGHYPNMKLAEARERARKLMQGTDVQPEAYSTLLDAYVAQHLKENC